MGFGGILLFYFIIIIIIFRYYTTSIKVYMLTTRMTQLVDLYYKQYIYT